MKLKKNVESLKEIIIKGWQKAQNTCCKYDFYRKQIESSIENLQNENKMLINI